MVVIQLAIPLVLLRVEDNLQREGEVVCCYVITKGKLSICFLKKRMQQWLQEMESGCGGALV